MKKSIVAVIALLAAATSASAQGFYPYDWWWGRSGLFSRDYITPSFDEPGYLYGDSRSARSKRSGKLIFAAATVDYNCQQDGSPRITVLDSSGGRISTDIGPFVAIANDGGSKRCIGRTVRGTRVYYSGRGSRVVLRVAYPTRGLTYDHVISVR